VNAAIPIVGARRFRATGERARFRIDFLRLGLAAAFALGPCAPSSGGDLLEAGGISTYALTSSRVLKCWGDDDFGQCGDGVTGPAHTNAIDVVGLAGGVVSISAGSRHACAVTSGGVLKCFGNDQYGQIGDGTLGGGLPNDSIPTPVSPIGLSSGVASVGVGMFHSCAVTTSGGAKCWGFNLTGQLGGANIGTDNPTPANVQGLTSGVAAIVGGYYHTCALTTTGGVKCWGNDQFGQLGDGTTGEGMSNSRSTPADVTGLTSGVVAIVAGQVHTCALTNTGGVKCWGNDSAGQLGDGATGPSDNPTPAFVPGLSDGVRAISAHNNEYTCALLLDGTVTCWGPRFPRPTR
jgi:alpha-tubulin suppressor-like RCC1 family protein